MARAWRGDRPADSARWFHTRSARYLPDQLPTATEVGGQDAPTASARRGSYAANRPKRAERRRRPVRAESPSLAAPTAPSTFLLGLARSPLRYGDRVHRKA